MGCILGFLALFFPRVVIVLVWLFTDYFQGVWSSLLWPILGFIFMPLTMLAFAFGVNYGESSISGIEIAVIVIAALFDMSSWGGGWRSTRKRTDVVKRE